MFHYTHPHIPHLSFLNVNYHKLKSGAVGKRSGLATGAICTGKSFDDDACGA